MMTTGIDLVEISRIRTLFNNAFMERILSKSERQFFEDIQNESRKFTFLAGRFAAKEALFKALKKGDLTLNYKDITILNDEDGAPYIASFPNSEGYHSEISISHTENYAIAIVLLEKKE
jgi:holo-[acyl-carrier protein] synthase